MTFSNILNTSAFAYSFGVELIFTSRSTFMTKWKPILDGLLLFLHTSGISVELNRGMSGRILSNIAILAKIQDKIAMKRGAIGVLPDLYRRNLAKLEQSNHPRVPPQTEACRYVKYAVAAYGVAMIEAAEVTVYGSVQWRKKGQSNNPPNTSSSRMDDIDERQRRYEQATSSYYDEDLLRVAISAHIDIPGEDIEMMNISHDNVDTLRHFIAVDREHKAIVWSIRGSLAMSDIIIDIGGFSSPFCGGEAHSQIAKSAEDLWKAAGDKILGLLKANDGFELVLCGHSLAAGVAALLNILLHEDKCARLGGRSCRCFAFASPPVFTPLDAAEDAVKACISYIHGNDCVPFLSVDSIRHLFAAINTIEDCKLTAFQRLRIMWGYINDIDLITLLRVERALTEALPVKQGAPVLLIPACVNVWMRQIDQDLLIAEDVQLDANASAELPPDPSFDAVLADSAKLAHLGIQLESSMVEDHFPNGYEASLYYLQD